MNLTTRYLGLDLPHPFVVGASPLADSIDTARRLEDAGAAAVVLRSLFEEQLAGEQLATARAFESTEGIFAEAGTMLPEPPGFALGPHEYLEQIRRLKSALAVPVVASLNGTSRGGWLTYASLMEAAGADALELNVYGLATRRDESSEMIERRTLGMVAAVKSMMRIPLAVKLSPYYTAFAHFAHRLDESGADGLVLFNRFYQPQIDPEALTVERTLHLSQPSELLLRLRWLAILSGELDASLACTGGVHSAEDAVKAVMSGAHAVQVVSCLLRQGPEYLTILLAGFTTWLEEHGYDSVAQMRGSMNFARCPDPAAYERANYMQMLHGWPSVV